jgi:hypothetical protein
VRDELSVLSAFLAVADERSFTRAAERLNISTSGLSHAIRRLEEQIGVRLLTRTTRSVSPTDAGEQLLAQLRPAFADIRGVLTSLSEIAVDARWAVSGSCVRGSPPRPSWVRSSANSCVPFRPLNSRSRPTTASTSARRRRRARLLRITPEADLSARRAEPSVHTIPAPRRERVQVVTR